MRSHGHIEKLKAQLKGEVQEWLALAGQADKAEISDGMSLPEEMGRRKKRLAVMAQAKAKIEARARKRFEREQAVHEAEARIAQREKKGDSQ